MAYLFRRDTSQRIPVVAHHTIGSLEGKVDTCIQNPYISRRHLCLEWSCEQWQLKDLSRNGTWLNGKRLDKGLYYPLSAGDTIQLAGDEGVSLSVEDVAPPKDILVSLDTHGDDLPVIELQAANLIPNDQTPYWYVYREANSNQWLAQAVADESKPPQTLSHNDILECGSQHWQLHCAAACAPTVEKMVPKCITEADIQFDVSLDEETTDLRIQNQGKNYHLGARAHHYLLLLLARHRAEDAKRGLDEQDQGWVANDLLIQELGLEPGHLNIQVYRARQQLTKTIPHINHDRFVERRGTTMRFGCNKFSIHKGGKVELQVP
ncbi:FHA domain-containing protein [Gilvimarinus xylanilyticus]|uniref:FHA domain-containing protein n=1 Tax=Gilvimarinus xylanilyticus TaxID=2944139 RepID=A0A9X2I8C3_9GAMM|nr:FHA domain-containing protein [Gilvimarinus xylanilyticus]MCP8900647.1 FHA domain-containing protein [Gilvimarinus xylanilyticus]